MQVDALAISLRARPMGEAADLGVRLVQVHAASVWPCFLPPLAFVLALALASAVIAPWLPAFVVFWAKPWLDRSLLFVFSRAVFGERTRWADLWAARRSVFFGGWFAALTRDRLSPWRAFVAPVAQLEGQHGSARRERCRVLLGTQRGAAMGLQVAYAHVELAALLALGSLLMWFVPESVGRDLWLALREGDALAVQLAFAVGYAAVIALLEPFHVASGFAMYLNRRVDLEAWDVEQELRHAFA